MDRGEEEVERSLRTTELSCWTNLEALELVEFDPKVEPKDSWTPPKE